ncbi:glycyl-tRNA synthetase [Xylariaceae sp. FL1019]|nr:glycyl-tRNA synthetase [Xylariaceae sp. FL1019]
MTTLKGQPLDRKAVESLLKRRFFYAPTADIYGGIAGFYDYGPPGCSLHTAIIDVWRRHFVLEEDMLEVDTPIVTPRVVLETSGHVQRFCDYVVKDIITGQNLRADHVVEEVVQDRLEKHNQTRDRRPGRGNVSKTSKLDDATVQQYEEILAKIDNYDDEALSDLISKHEIRNPNSGNRLVLPVQTQNLMFNVPIGSDKQDAFLRPETAQGQFLNFSKLLEFNQNSIPFASASVGKSGRNEISPKAGLIRVKEFTMAEIEHYVDPESDKRHKRFDEISDVQVNLLTRQVQLAGKTIAAPISIGEAMRRGVINNQTVGYFMARIQLFLLKIGISPEKIRFREHMDNEMAHYAQYCVDAELLTSYGWIEAVGCADRSAYDLSRHTEASGVPLVVREARETPLEITEFVADLKKSFWPHFKKDASLVQAALARLTQHAKAQLSSALSKTGTITIDVPGVGQNGKVELTSDLVVIEQRTRMEHNREYVPGVIEPSFGIGRILYCLCEHVFWTREDTGERPVLSFPPAVAPNKVLLVSLDSSPDFKPLLSELTRLIRKRGLSTKVDSSHASIGKRYARNDELGTPFAVTVDFQTLEDKTVTLRDRDTRAQVRASPAEIVDAVVQLVNGTLTWYEVVEKFPIGNSL